MKTITTTTTLEAFKARSSPSARQNDRIEQREVKPTTHITQITLRTASLDQPLEMEVKIVPFSLIRLSFFIFLIIKSCG
jgi:hypothetical protein